MSRAKESEGINFAWDLFRIGAHTTTALVVIAILFQLERVYKKNYYEQLRQADKAMTQTAPPTIEPSQTPFPTDNPTDFPILMETPTPDILSQIISGGECGMVNNPESINFDPSKPAAPTASHVLLLIGRSGIDAPPYVLIKPGEEPKLITQDYKALNFVINGDIICVK